MEREPTVNKVAWRLEHDLSFAELGDEVRRRGELDLPAWERLLSHRGLHVDRERVDPSAPPELILAGAEVRAYTFVVEPEYVVIGREHVIFTAPGVIAINKPPGIPVQATRASVRLSLEAQLKALCAVDWISPAHRLDRDTSGLILFATDPRSASGLYRQFERREVSKTYLAWTRPSPVAAEFEVQGYLFQESHPRHARYAMSAVARPEARHSLTRFERLCVLGERALVRARPLTGRTHQIRIHLAEAGAPIEGDRLYGSAESEPAAPRLLLHAESLRLRLPGATSPSFLSAPPPSDFGPPAANVSPP